jgi:hypothetical protein
VTLYHYTCDHGRAAIGEAGELLPAYRLTDAVPEHWWPARFVWLTDLRVPDRYALGLNQVTLKCDRTTHRYRATDERGVVPWIEARKGFRRSRHLLEDAPGVMLRHWYVCPIGVPVVLDPRQ